MENVFPNGDFLREITVKVHDSDVTEATFKFYKTELGRCNVELYYAESKDAEVRLKRAAIWGNDMLVELEFRMDALKTFLEIYAEKMIMQERLNMQLFVYDGFMKEKEISEKDRTELKMRFGNVRENREQCEEGAKDLLEEIKS